MKASFLPLLLLLASPLSVSASSSNDYSEDITDLYSEGSAVVHMDHTNFNSLLLGKRHVWVVEFYSSWCGHCMMYAPTWLRIAEQSAGWDSVMKVSAINCARPQNRAICRKYGDGSSPLVMLFPPLSGEEDMGEKMQHKLQEEMLEQFVDRVTKLQAKTHPHGWPDLAPYTGSLSEFLSSPEPLHALVVEDSASSSVGRQVVLDLSGQRHRLRLARAVLPPPDFQLTETARPLLVTFRGGQRQADLVSREGLPPRQLFTEALRRALGITDERRPADGQGSGQKTVKVVGAAGEQGAAPAADAVYMVDLENAVTYALRQEVAGKKNISGESLTALRNFVATLIKYLPVRKSVIEAITELETFLEGEEEVGGAEIERHLESAESQLPPRRPWYGCRGSVPGLRGYTCALWSLFHTLTVQAHQVKKVEEVSILPAIHGYVKNFFSCSHCSQHFQEMSAKEGLFSVTSSSQAVLWLWRAHNMVNKRLAGDQTEDPKHPKVQFPTRKQCRACFFRNNYFRPIVVSFLLNFYGKDAIKPDGLVEDEAVTATAAAVGLQPAEASDDGPSNRVELVSRVRGQNWTSDQVRGLSSGLHGPDIGLCILFWLSGFIILVFAFLFFKMKRFYKRKHSKGHRSFFKYCLYW